MVVHHLLFHNHNTDDMNENSFFSIDRLMEFGLGMAVAQQMINTMNESMKNMYIPGSMNQMQQAPQVFYYADNGHSVGPLSPSEMTDAINNGVINKDTLVWTPGMVAWQSASEVPSVLKLIALTPPPLNP